MPRNGKEIPSDNPIAQQMMHETGLGLHQIAWRHNGVAGGVLRAKKNVEAAMSCISATDEAKYYAQEAHDALTLLSEALEKRKDQV